MTALDIARRTRSGERCRPLVAAALDRIANDGLNAFITADAEALSRANDVDAMVERGEDPGALAGVPIALKDIVDHAGRVTTAGSSFYRHSATRSAPVVERLESAGAVVVGRTGLHEFALGFSSENDWFGPIRNPWDPTTSPGGSSGGSAAAVAADIVTIALGTDTGGSIRVPAALCGCVGLKVTHGRIPLTGVFPLAPSRDTVGPIATTVADAAAAYLVMAGDDPSDPWSHPVPVSIPAGPTPLTGLRFGIPHPWVDRPLAPEVESAWHDVRVSLTRSGAEVLDVEAPMLDPRNMPRAVFAELAVVHREWYSAHPEKYGTAIRERVGLDMNHTADAVTGAWTWRQGLIGAFERAMTGADVLLTPTTPTRRKVIGEDLVAAGAAPEPHRPALSWFTSLVNHAGLPALALPLTATSTDGPPVSIQLIGPSWGEHRLLGIGLGLEEVGLVGFKTPPG